MDPIRYTFRATVKACEPAFTTITRPSDMTYTLGDDGVKQTYKIEQNPNCYLEQVVLSPTLSWLSLTLPWLSVDKNKNEIELTKTDDRSFIGAHPITLTKFVLVPDSTLSTYTKVQIQEKFTVYILDPC